ncbi:dipeptide/oligopeptide/nickel ABC transporter permease/ATP-binding protein [Pseudarthrobacter sulfonivorans]|uniref:dipeptide/oligopeptide/nickel ABC transporter permease/ATP-binding protein n=1 Tax=Pseudarthrobacter sulfonivorans TaxID=121292 RepID=UPI001CC2BC07|nr:dipeptide/oligopeptide/nickel ABC transporter permease/ATP-binding protein [Pseudarthrobacter sulfonivorans]
MTLIGLIVLGAIIIPWIGGGAADALTEATALPPSSSHLLGTDLFGRDMFMRAMVATGLSLLMTFGATVLSVVFGIGIGTSIRFLPDRVRGFCLRLVEIAVSYPSLLVAVVIAAILGSGPWQLVLAIGLSGIPSMARLSSTLAASVYEKDFVTTARLVGVPNRFIITRHLLPNMAEPLLIQTASVFSFGLIAISALSFVGLGVQTPQYDLGRLLADGLPSIYTRPLDIVGPTVMIVLISLAAMLIGDGLAAAADPRASLQRPARAKTDRPAVNTPVPAPDSLVSVQDLVVHTSNGVPLVHGLSFRIGHGEILGLVGESGSGKSLTAMSLARLLPDGLSSHASQMKVGELDLLQSTNGKSLANTLALVYQDPGTTFNPSLRMRSQLTEVLRVHRGYSARRAKEVIVEILRKMRIDDPDRLLDSRPHELSGGMRQRAMIASALVTDPALIIADEPTTALDVTVQADILREFKRINRERSMSMLFISHDIGVVEALCDRVIIMKDGRLLEELTAEQLRTGEVSHPYTRRLLDAVPRIDDVRKERP